MLLGAVDHPAQLCGDLLGARWPFASTEQSFEQPRVPECPARKHHGRRAGLLEAPQDVLIVGEASGEDHRRLERLDQLGGEPVIGAARVLLGGVARVEGDRGDAGLVDQPAREQNPALLPGALPGAELHGDRQPRALGRRAGDRDRLVGIVEQCRPGARLADLADRAPHVEVDQIGARLGDDRGGLPHHVGVVSEKLDRDRMLVGMEPQELLVGASIAVLEPEARDHLRDRQPGSVTTRLEPNEPVADPGQRGQDEPVG